MCYYSAKQRNGKLPMKRSESNAKESGRDEEVHTLLGPGAKFDGKLIFQGVLRIDGEFKGDIETEDTLIIGESGEVNASISVGRLILRGSFSGSARIKQKAEMFSKARFMGDIETPGLMIEDGVLFEGQCRMNKSGLMVERPGFHLDQAPPPN